MRDSKEIAPPGAANYSAAEVLRDGASIQIRAIRPDDKERLLQHFQSLSPQSVYYRFFGFKRSLDDADLRRLTELDFVNQVGLVATTAEDGSERFVGIGRYVGAGDSRRAEVAFAVLDDYHGRGIGTLLLKHLAHIAQMNAIEEFVAYVMGSNRQMLEVFANSGFRVHDSYEAGAVRVSLDIDAPVAKP